LVVRVSIGQHGPHGGRICSNQGIANGHTC
jgi:hypothetical protein